MSKRIIRVGLIGCGGNMRGAHVPRIKAVAAARIVAAADPVPEAAEQAAKAWGKPIALYDDYRRMLANERLDAVVISTPHCQHYAQVCLALGQGMHVLVEKPLVTRAKHAKELLEFAKKKRRILHVSYQRHHWPAYRHIRNLIASGKLGTLRAVVGYVTQGWMEVRGWRLDPALSGGGMFMDTGSHLVAAALFTCGLHVREVTALIDNAGKNVDINAAVSIRFDNGAVGNLTTIGNAGQHDEGLALHGDKGCIVISQHHWALKDVRLDDQPLKVPKSLKPDDPDAAFFRWIGGAKGYESPMYALEVARISEAVYKSVELNRPVKVRR